MKKEVKEELRIRHKKMILDLASAIGNTRKICREFDVNRSSFYQWKRKYEREGIAGLRNKKPIPLSYPNQIPQEVVQKIIELRRTYNFGPIRITWYLERYHGMKASCSTVYRTLVRNGMSRLPKTAPRRAIHSIRYAKTVPGHHVQVDVKFVWLKDLNGARVRRFQYTAIDDATRIRAIRIYRKHNQQNAIDFVDYVIKKFPFRIHTIRTDRGHEFQAKFHWHVEDNGMRHVYIKPRSPQLNGKVERSHRTDNSEFYQLLTYIDDTDLNKKLSEWERFYNYDRPHGAHNGKTPYEVMRASLLKSEKVSTRI